MASHGGLGVRTEDNDGNGEGEEPRAEHAESAEGSLLRWSVDPDSPEVGGRRRNLIHSVNPVISVRTIFSVLQFVRIVSSGENLYHGNTEKNAALPSFSVISFGTTFPGFRALRSDAEKTETSISALRVSVVNSQQIIPHPCHISGRWPMVSPPRRPLRSRPKQLAPSVGSAHIPNQRIIDKAWTEYGRWHIRDSSRMNPLTASARGGSASGRNLWFALSIPNHLRRTCDESRRSCECFRGTERCRRR